MKIYCACLEIQIFIYKENYKKKTYNLNTMCVTNKTEMSTIVINVFTSDPRVMDILSV